uniref:Uncharacterized protein n=1 Tax=Eutreptiella gymnastica TaxID=73025 RepID=A0A6T2AIL6_9EUGL
MLSPLLLHRCLPKTCVSSGRKHLERKGGADQVRHSCAETATDTRTQLPMWVELLRTRMKEDGCPRMEGGSDLGTCSVPSSGRPTSGDRRQQAFDSTCWAV